MKYLELAEQVLTETKTPLSADEIWNLATKKGLDKQLDSIGKTPWATLGALLYVNVRDHRGEPFLAVGTRPKRFYVKGILSSEDAKQFEDVPESIEKGKKGNYLERDLHPLLARYAFLSLKAFTKTLNHSKTSKKAFSEWLHPDMVGFHSPLGVWAPEVLDFGTAVSAQSVKLFSFEMKRELDFSNLREAFFQAVSNSSWAHEAYLAAAFVEEDEGFRSELQRLSTSFGIGIIRLDLNDPDSSETLFPAHTRDSLDWEGVNKLAINPDFSDFLIRVRNDISSREVREERYDKVLEPEQLRAMLAKLK